MSQQALALLPLRTFDIVSQKRAHRNVLLRIHTGNTLKSIGKNTGQEVEYDSQANKPSRAAVLVGVLGLTKHGCLFGGAGIGGGRIGPFHQTSNCRVFQGDGGGGGCESQSEDGNNGFELHVG